MIKNRLMPCGVYAPQGVFVYNSKYYPNF